MQVRFKKLENLAVLPSYAKPGDAGLDLTAISVEWYCHEVVKIRTGIAVEIPEGYVGLIFPRSSIFKTKMRLTNAVGVIDSGYRGEICFYFDILNMREPYQAGDRVGQLVIMPYPKIEVVEANELTQTERGENGFGSSGK